MIKYLIFAALLLLAGAFVRPEFTSAASFDPFGPAVCSDAEAKAHSAVCNAKTTDPVAGSNGLLINIANIIAFIAGGAAIIIIVYGGIKFITSGGDAGKVKSARETVFYALIGIAVILLARTIIYFVVSYLK